MFRTQTLFAPKRTAVGRITKTVDDTPRIAKTAKVSSNSHLNMSHSGDPPMSEKDQKIWSRMIGKRRNAWESLPRSELVAIVQPFYRTETPSPPVFEDPWERTEWLLKRYFSRSVDRTLAPETRRAAWDRLNNLLQQLDGKNL